MIYNQKLLQPKGDRRRQVEEYQLINFPYNCIGKIRVYNQAYKSFVNGTGFLISSSLVLTSAHNFEDFSQKFQANDFDSSSFMIYDNMHGAPKKNNISIQDYRVCHEFKQIQKQLSSLQMRSDGIEKITDRKKIISQIMSLQLKEAKNDFALLKLSHNIKRHKYFKLHCDFDHLSTLVVCGFNLSDSLRYHSNKAAQVTDGVIYYDIDTQEGQSGSPVYDQKNNQILVGIHKAYSAQKKLNMAVMITHQLISTLQKWSNQMAVSFQVVNRNPDMGGKKYTEEEFKRRQLNSKLQHAFTEIENLKLQIKQQNDLTNKIKHLKMELQEKDDLQNQMKFEIEIEAAKYNDQIAKLVNTNTEMKRNQQKYKETILDLKSLIFKLEQERLSRNMNSLSLMNSKYTTNQNEDKNKRAIIVFGQMKHGKSAFVKMLACPQDKLLIHAKANIKMMAGFCSLYKVDPKLQLHHEDLYIIDTPGPQSEDAVFVILQHLDELIFRDKLEIGGLIFVLDIKAGRQINDKVNSFMFTFYEHLKLRNSVKKQMTTCVLSHFDQYQQKKQNNKLLAIFGQKFAENGMEQIWKRNIFWMSEPDEDRKQYKRIIRDQNHKVHQIWLLQWQTLKKHLKENKFQDFNYWLKDKKQYRKNLRRRISEQLIKHNTGARFTFFIRKLKIKTEDGGFFSKSKFAIQENREDQKIHYNQQFMSQLMEIEKSTTIEKDQICIKESAIILGVEGQINYKDNKIQVLNFKVQGLEHKAKINEGYLQLKYRIKVLQFQEFIRVQRKVAKYFYTLL